MSVIGITRDLGRVLKECLWEVLLLACGFAREWAPSRVFFEALP